MSQTRVPVQHGCRLDFLVVMIFRCNPEDRNGGYTGGVQRLCEFDCCSGLEDRVVRPGEQGRLLSRNHRDCTGSQFLDRSLIARQSGAESLPVSAIQWLALTRESGNRSHRVVLWIELLETRRLPHIIEEEGGHRRQIRERNTHHEISASSLFIRRKTCASSSR